jgi:site-specific DNA recombinase
MAQKHVGVFIRVSTDMQVKEESPEHHIKRAELYAQTKDWQIAEIYRLDGVSGKSVMEHPETKRMLADIKSGHITGLVFSKLARLARNNMELLQFSKFFQEHNADLISLAESIDTSTPAGRFFFALIAALAEWEREEISSRVAASVPIRAKLGKSLGGAASFGYAWKDKVLVIDEKEAPIRKLMYEIFLKQRRIKTTADVLNSMGYRTRKGDLFSDNTVNRLLRDPTAKGERRANYTKSTGANKQWELKPKSDWIIIPCPAIIDSETWDECNLILDEQEGKRKKAGRKPIHLLSGFVLCHCGNGMYITHSSNNYACKKCKNRIAAPDLDSIYQENLKSYLTENDPEKYSEELIESVRAMTERYNTMAAERNRLTKRMEQLVNMRIDGELDKEVFAELYKPIETQALQMNEQLPEMESEIMFRNQQQLSTDAALAEAKSLYDQWSDMSFDQKRGIVETITSQIVIGKEDINIRLSCKPTFSRNEGLHRHSNRDSSMRST